MKKTALVTGGNSGIGYATAALLKKKGYEVFIAARDAEKIQHAAAELGVSPLVGDMGKLADIQKLATNFSQTGVDVLVNNAGIIVSSPIGLYQAEDFSRLFDINVRGPLFLIQELLPALKKNQGAVTTVSSIIVRHGARAGALYAASKGAVEAFTRSLAIELAPCGIRVNAVAPGAIETPIFTKAGLKADQVNALLEKHLAEIPLMRRGNASEVAQVIVAQVESSYVTGSVWNVDGGISA